MVSVCLYFQVHQPLRLRRYSLFEIGKHSNYFDDEKNKAILQKVARKSYLPANNVLLGLIRRLKGAFKVSFSISGVCLEQFEAFAPEVLESFRELAETGCVEFLTETYYHSLAYLYSKPEFLAQVKRHTDKVRELFGQTPRVFRHTELILNNELAKLLEDLGFLAVLGEGADHILSWRSPNFLYTARSAQGIKLLLKNYKLSDDIAFRFGNTAWEEYPLTAEKFAQWVSAANGNGDVVNLFMDYETFGEHQWEDTGIFHFLEALPGEILKHPDNDFVTVSEAALRYPVRGEVDMHNFVSWADVERDVSAWLGNAMQRNALSELYKLEAAVKAKRDEKLVEDWRRLTTSDHAYYMCTKWFSDGDVHKYFNPYDSPYEAFIAFMNVLNDLALRVASVEGAERGREQVPLLLGNPSLHVCAKGGVRDGQSMVRGGAR
ncbi:alpha-amylase [Candidatus Woesearchaeota archaeon]|nr:MAG: alpha-amylase [Candidatus Woesearchaeota archaeon]